MTAQPPNPELQEALLELQQYLSDSVPPLVVADSVQLLMKYPPQALIPTIRAWTAAALGTLPTGSVARVDVEITVPARYRITIEWPVAGLGMQRLVLPVTT